MVQLAAYVKTVQKCGFPSCNITDNLLILLECSHQLTSASVCKDPDQGAFISSKAVFTSLQTSGIILTQDNALTAQIRLTS